MSLMLETLCLLSCRGPACTLDCKELCSTCEGCNECCTPHPYNCKYFFFCSNGKVDIKQCPPNTGFNPMTFICEENFPCFLPDCLRLCTTINCIEDCCAPNDCNSYFQCKRGLRKLKFCKKSHFNPTSLACERDYSCSINDKRKMIKDDFLNAVNAVYLQIESSKPINSG